MLVLNTVNQSIQIVLSGAKSTADPSYVSTYADNDGSVFTEGEKNGSLNGTTPVTVVAAPGASTRRIIKEIVVYNEDSSNITLTVSLLDTGITRNLVRKILVAGDYWKWTERVVGEKGDKGDIGLEPTIAVGAVSAVAYGVPPTVTNVGTPVAAIFNFQLETGPTGLTGATGANGIGAPVDAGGTPDAITATYSPPATLVDHTICLFVASGANTTTTPTFAPDGLAAHVITKKGGSALAVGDIPAAGAVCILEYNLANTRWELLNPAVGGGIPTGGMLDWPTETVPDGYLERDGSSLNRTTYAALFTVLGTTYGTADGSHFNLPDHRGRFMRSWAHGSANDPNRATRTKVGATGATMTAGDHVGTEQAYTVEAHYHSIITRYYNTYPYGASAANVWASDTADNTGSYGGSETRPINAYAMPIIKY